MKQKKHNTQKPLRVLTTSIILGVTAFTSVNNLISPIEVIHAEENVMKQNVSSIAMKALEAPIVEAYRGSNSFDYHIKGRGQANTKIVITVQQKQFEGTVNTDGTWEMVLPIRVSSANPEKFILTLVDNQGNTSKETVHTHRGVNNPSPFLAADYGEISGVIYNIFEGKAIARVGNETYEGIIENGAFLIKTPKLVVGTKVEVNIKGYYFSENWSLTVVDRTVPDAPAVNDFTDEDTKLTGTGEANAKVTIMTGTTSYEGTINSEGNWSVSIPKQVENTKLQVIVTDASGNKSKSAEVIVKSAKWNAPKLNKVGDSDTEITGTTEEGAKVVAKIGNQSYEGLAKADGNFSINIPKQVAGTEVIVKMTK
ncbi:Ig-like domain-containing protein, partial [Bacillus wiedmannii]|uniref:Ig-like domain-containing protein n=1 Tax=Bacillus wiedmannii TaxID=1890302 RepID=UPI002E2219C1|nr:Ig-like domain-containing protein [Bacillus wiedmannii]